MLRIHLAQILFKPAYFNAPVDFLSEPSPILEPTMCLSSFKSEDAIQSFLIDSKSEYLEHIRYKVESIVEWCAERESNFLVFPEYSIPYQILPEIKKLAQKNGLIIVGGTHRVMKGKEIEKIYHQIGAEIQSNLIARCACSPIFFPDGSTKLSIKLKGSKWEPNLEIKDYGPFVYRAKSKNESIYFSVIPCIDCLHTDILGRVFDSKKDTPKLIICPSYSPSVDPFVNVASLVSLRDVVFAYVNTSLYGGSFFNLPSKWESYSTGNKYSKSIVEKNVEAVIEFDVNPDLFFQKIGSIISAPECAHPSIYPIIYKKNSSWLKKFNKLCSDIREWLNESDIDSAIEWLDNYLIDDASEIPNILKDKLRFLRHSKLTMFDGKIENVETALRVVLIPEPIEDTAITFSIYTNEALKIVSDYIADPNTQYNEQLFSSLRALKESQKKLPRLKNNVELSQKPVRGKVKSSLGFKGEEDLIESFQNRGPDLDRMREIMSNLEYRLIVITGAIGIGKSSFLSALFRKVLKDWKIIRIKVASESTFARVFADISYSLDYPLDIDAISYSSQKVFRQKMQKILKSFFSFSNQALIIDDLHQLLSQKNARDFSHLKWFIEEATNIKKIKGGRIFLVSSQWLPESWIKREGVKLFYLKTMHETYIRRILEYQMRVLSLLDSEKLPDIPQDYLNLIKGHPLSAKLMVVALRRINQKDIYDSLTVEKISGYIAKELLRLVCIEDKDELLLIRLSVFRIPISMERILTIDNFKSYQKQILELNNKGVLSYDGEYIEMHESIRRFFLNKITSKNDIKKYHLDATEYYSTLYELEATRQNKNPSILAEFAHHLSKTGQIEKIKNIRDIVLTEIKPIARQIYREYHDYQNALDIYRLVHEVVPDDIEVLAYLGRCYARLQQWHDCDRYFYSAIDIAKKRKKPFWWIYRDWGHLKARFNYFGEALECFDTAIEFNPYDPSISAAIAFMHQRQGKYEKAKEYYEEALSFNGNHEFTLIFYSKLLEYLGDNEYASILRERLKSLEDEITIIEPADYEIEDDFDE